MSLCCADHAGQPGADQPSGLNSRVAPDRCCRCASREAGAPATAYFMAENDVGCSSWLTMLAMIGPSSSDLARAVIHSWSAMKVFHLVSRSAIDSQPRM